MTTTTVLQPMDVVAYGITVFCVAVMVPVLVVAMLASVTWRGALLNYGKLTSYQVVGDKQQWSLWHVRKRWFSHFYLVGLGWNTYLVWIVARGKVFGCVLDVVVRMAFPFVPLSHHGVEEDGGAEVVGRYSRYAFVYFALMQLQLIRRLYECLWVSQSHPQSHMSLAHYAYGMVYYCVVCLVPLTLVHPTGVSSVETNLFLLTSGVLLFGYASVKQHESHRILAHLRAGRRHVAYRVPMGGWFCYVSSPHYFFEIMIYASLSLVVVSIMGYHAIPAMMASLSVLLLVMVTLARTATESHRWYCRHFPDYPRDRKVLIPFLY
jgi:3-oxo-5-alpha-steroid 4-dehydrogenase 3